uniref:RING-type domain-containing protein n=1 Tax=Amblyomma aureolatum TaxID=187763 RepID=A0A1E1XF27_9ACAR
MQGAGRKKLVELNEHLTCVLCGGYFVDATTIIECLHSFCKTCIVKYLQVHKMCPVCDVQVHKTRPLQNIRSDPTLQDIVYKLVPGLYKNEMRRRRQYYASLAPSERASLPISSEGRGDIQNVERLIFNYEDLISLTLEYSARDILPLRPLLLGPPPPENQESPPGSRRYLLCPGGFTVGHLKKFLRAKFGLAKNHEVDVMYMHDHLVDDYTLIDLAYIYSWRRNAPMRLLYRFPELPPSLVSSGSKTDDVVPVPPDEGKSIVITAPPSQQAVGLPTGVVPSRKGSTPLSDTSANTNTVHAVASHGDTNGANHGGEGHASARHTSSGCSYAVASLSSKDSAVVSCEPSSEQPEKPNSVNSENPVAKQPVDIRPNKLPEPASPKQGVGSQPGNVSSASPTRSPQSVKLPASVNRAPCLPRVTSGVRTSVEQKVPPPTLASANRPVAYPGHTPGASPPASRVVTGGQRPGSKAPVFSKIPPLSHRKNGLSTANGVHSNLRLILPAPAKANGVTDSTDMPPRNTKGKHRPSDSPNSPAKRPHLDSRPGKEAAVS